MKQSLCLVCILVLGIPVASGGSAADLMTIDGITITRGPSSMIPATEGAKTALAFQFGDGRIVVGSGENCRWSDDGGKTWSPGPSSPGNKVTIDLGGGEILSISAKTQKREDGRYAVKQQRSLDNWVTHKSEVASLETPDAGKTVLGGGDVVDGYLFHHGVILLNDGRLIATVYGTNIGDTALCEGYPEELGQFKYRTMVVFSNDRGRTWGNPVLVAYDRMLGRGIPVDHPKADESSEGLTVDPLASVPAITQEGFREADLAMAPNGDLVCVLRSGGRNGGPATLFPTPLYCSRSSDLGKSWSLPAQIADRGVNPNLVVLDNGIIACTYGRPGSWLIFSDDNGLTWKGAFQFGSTGSYNYIAKTGPDSFMVFHEVDSDAGKVVYGSTFSVAKSPVR